MTRYSKIERYKRSLRDDPPREHLPAVIYEPVGSRACGVDMSKHGWKFEDALWVFSKCGEVTKDPHEFTEGFYGTKSCLHFVGFRGEEYWSAVRIWGKPDYTWPQATFQILGDCAPADTVIFGPSAFNKPKKWRAAA